MESDLRAILRRKSVRVSFERSISLVGATTLGVGALMGAGIYVLIGPAAAHSGPSVWLAYLICGLLTVPSVLMFGELSRLVPRAGGGYVYSYQGLGSLAGFVTGWLLACGSIFACAMYSLGLAYYLVSAVGITAPDPVIRGVAILAAVGLTLLNCGGTRGGEKAQRIFTWGNLLVLAVLIGSAFLQADTSRSTLALPHGLGGLAGAIAIVYISFFGYQLIANNVEEIVEPQVTIPRAMLLSITIALAFYVAVAVVSVLCIPWQQLAGSPAPLLDVASRALGSGGWWLVGGGAVLASAAALNSTILSQGRQIYAMGSHNFLPSILGKIHEGRKTPRAALLAGGLLTALTVAVAELEFVAKTANFCFIFSLLIVSFALASLQRGAGSDGISRWKQSLPVVAFICNLALLVTIDWLSLIFGLQLIAFGLFVYLGYSRRREIRSRLGMSFALVEGERARARSASRILAPMANPKTQGAIYSISQALLARDGGEIVVLSVLTAPEQVDFVSALEDAGEALQLLESGTRLPRPGGVRVRPVMRVSRSLAKGILHAAEEENCQLIVMGYGSRSFPQSATLMEEVLADASTDVILLKGRSAFPPSRIAVSLGSRNNLGLIVRLAEALADQFGGHITFLNILPENYSARERSRTSAILAEAMQQQKGRALFRTEVLSSADPLETLVERSRDFDLLIAGTRRVGLLKKAVVGSFGTQLVERAHCSVALVRVTPLSKRALASLS